MEDHNLKRGSPQGTGVAAKGDTTSHEPLRPLDDASTTFPSIPLPGHATPSEVVANPDETLANPPRAPKTPVYKPSSTNVDPDAPQSVILSASEVPAAASIYVKPALQPGDRLVARYEVLSLLGKGGMGSVYKALDREVGRTVALKLIRPEL